MINNITDFKVFKFENAEEECVIAKDYKEACDYYKSLVGDDIEDFNITEVENWYYVKIKCETSEKQEDGTYFKMRTMADVADEYYSNGYTGPQVISTTVVS